MGSAVWVLEEAMAASHCLFLLYVKAKGEGAYRVGHNRGQEGKNYGKRAIENLREK